MTHIPVLLHEILGFLPGEPRSQGRFLDVTAGGGGHFSAVLAERANWTGECWDRDPLARARLEEVINKNNLAARAKFVPCSFGKGPAAGETFDFILADLGVSSFQLDDRSRGMSLFSEVKPDFRMNPLEGLSLYEWIQTQSTEQLSFMFEEFGEEPRAKKLASEMKTWSQDDMSSCLKFAEKIKSTLRYPEPSRTHPATRAFQALRIAVNDELGELKKLLTWAPQALEPNGVLAIISFHSVEDRFVKNAFRDLAQAQAFDILTKKPTEASESERDQNPRARSAKLRVLKKRS